MTLQNKKLLLIELNEINIDYVKKYIDSGLNLPGFKKFLSNYFQSSSENEYQNLEPWIQWPSVHTGLSFQEHQIFRLGDIVYSDHPQIFEIIEKLGYKVGAISPMNTANRLKDPCYFIPDPWTKTSSDKSLFSKLITKAVSQAVNDNAQKRINIISYITLFFAAIWSIRIKRYHLFFKLIMKSRNNAWVKSLILDFLLHEIHLKQIKRFNPNFSTVFLNAGAHIQHHYLFNSVFCENLTNPDWYIKKEQDPFKEMIILYDIFLEDYFAQNEYETIIATGLSQFPHNRVEYYWRLKNHKYFLSLFDIYPVEVNPRMTRDFEIKFLNQNEAIQSKDKLEKITLNEKSLFGEIELRDRSLFVVLTYDNDISEETLIDTRNNQFLLKDHISFVAIKNGAHQSKGYIYLSEGINQHPFVDGDHVKGIHNSIIKYFNS